MRSMVGLVRSRSDINAAVVECVNLLKNGRSRAHGRLGAHLDINVRHRPLDDRHADTFRHYAARPENLALVRVRLDVADLRSRAGDAEAAVAVEWARVDHAA